jgi:hypothetical protein
VLLSVTLKVTVCVAVWADAVPATPRTSAAVERVRKSFMKVVSDHEGFEARPRRSMSP